MHVLQPKHLKLKKEDVDKLLKKYNISVSQLPRIASTDVTIASLNAQLGDVIKIERKTDKGEEEYFRVVA